AQVQVFGQQKYAVRVQVDPNALAARGVGINEVEQAVSQANVNLPTGTLYGKERMFAVQASGQLNDAAAFRPIIVTYRNGSPVRLQELGDRKSTRLNSSHVAISYAVFCLKKKKKKEKI